MHVTCVHMGLVFFCFLCTVTYCRAQSGRGVSAAPCSSPPSPPSTALTQQEDQQLHTVKDADQFSIHTLWIQFCSSTGCTLKFFLVSFLKYTVKKEYFWQSINKMWLQKSFWSTSKQRIHSNMEASVSFSRGPALGQHLWNSFFTSTNEKKHSGRTRF